MPTLHVKLGPDETDLLGLLAEAHPAPLAVEDCDVIALDNLVAIRCARIGGRRVWINADGLALWATRTPTGRIRS
jgi:hypothetical protein